MVDTEIKRLKKMKRFNENTYRVLLKIEAILKDEISADPEKTGFCIHACVYSPVSFLMIVFRAMHHIDGLDPSKTFPNFITVYKNYLKALTDMEEDWKNLPFDEFEKKFAEKYQKLGHHVTKIED